MNTDSIYISRRECVKCWRCIRECPVKAIRADAECARIEPSECTACGHCLSICRFGAVKLREDIYAVREMIKNNAVNVASVTPQWVTEMDGLGEGKFVEALKLLGFTHVSETALGAGIAQDEERDTARKGGTVISSRCPAVVSYVAKYSPRHLGSLSPLATPMEIHARLIRHWWGNDASVTHFTTCPAAKREAGSSGSGIYAVLTYEELRKWLREEGVEAGNLFGSGEYRFEPFSAGRGLLYNLCGEPSNETPAYAASPLQEVAETLKSFPADGNGELWLDLMACKGGCTGSGARSKPALPAFRQLTLLRERAAGVSMPYGHDLPRIRTERDRIVPDSREDFVPESETLLALDELGMPTRALQTDCNACGFGTCRRFAKAYTRGEVPKEMCWFYLKTETAAKFTTLLAKLSSGVAIVNSSLCIEQANRMFASMMGPQAEALFDAHTGLPGVPAAEVIPFCGLVASVLESGDESIVRDIQIGERLLTVSVHTVQKNRLALVICRNMIFSQVRNEEIVKRTQRVIDENLETVRKIASLLGENASRTEAILNSILDAHSRENE